MPGVYMAQLSFLFLFNSSSFFSFRNVIHRIRRLAFVIFVLDLYEGFYFFNGIKYLMVFSGKYCEICAADII